MEKMNKQRERGNASTEVMKMRKMNRDSMKKEKIIMLMSSVFVLSALTVTGVYVREKNAAGQNGYIVDLSEMEDKVTEKADEIAKSKAPVIEDDLDYDPSFTEAGSGHVENPNLQKSVEQSVEQTKEVSAREESEKSDLSNEQETAKEALGDSVTAEKEVAQAVHFSETDGLQWPITGNVLLNFSMDKTIYFPTLAQYKYNPAIVIAATEGENITAAAAGEVVRIYEDAETGQTIVMNLGDGYELTYGQLENVQVYTGDYVEAGVLLGTVAAPTKYYSVEGCNVYFKLTKDGVPVNPLGKLS